MKQKLLTDIELDVHELKLLMNTFSKEPTQTLSELLKRSILRMQERLEQLSEEISAVPVEASPSPVAEAETEAPIPIVEEQAPVIEEVECSAIEEPVVEENEATVSHVKKALLPSATVLPVREMTRSVLSCLSRHWLRTSRSSLHGV